MNVLVKVNITCALRWGVVFIGFTLLGVAHLIRDNISGTELAPEDSSHSGLQG